MFKKIYFILNKEQRRNAGILGFLLFIGVLLEMLGVGILLPVLTIIASPDYTFPINEMPVLRNVSLFKNVNTTYFLMASLAILFLIKTVFLIFLGWRSAKFASEMEAEVSSRLLSGYLNEPYLFHTQKNTSELLRNIKIEVAQFIEFIYAFIAVIIETGIITGLLISLLIIDANSTLIIIILFSIPCLVLYLFLRNKLKYWGEKRQIYEEMIQRHALQGLGLVKEIKLGNKEKYFRDAFRDSSFNRALVITNQRTVVIIPRLYLELITVLALSIYISIMYANGYLLSSILPTLGVFGFAAFRIMPSVNRIMAGINFMRYSQPVANLIYNELKKLNVDLIEKQEKTARKFNFSKSLVFNNVSYEYENSERKQIDDISLEIEKGDSVGFTGSTGSGKTTIINIILGLLSPTAGNFYIDGLDISEIKEAWQNQIGYVPQQITLLDDTITKNIAFGVADAQIDNTKVADAIKMAQLNQFIQTLPDGLDTVIGEDGVRMSGGQRQRIGLARALYHNPDILVLDEATSALDHQTEEDLMKAVSDLDNDKTIIMIAHRLSTLNNCDWIFELDKGKIYKKSGKQFLED